MRLLYGMSRSSVDRDRVSKWKAFCRSKHQMLLAGFDCGMIMTDKLRSVPSYEMASLPNKLDVPLTRQES